MSKRVRLFLLISFSLHLLCLLSALPAFSYDEVMVQSCNVSGWVYLGMTQQELIASVGAPSRVKSDGRCMQYDEFDISVFLDEGRRVDRIYMGKNFSGRFAGNTDYATGPGQAFRALGVPSVSRTYTPSSLIQNTSTVELENSPAGSLRENTLPMEYRGQNVLYKLSSNGSVIKSKYVSDDEGVAYYMDKKGLVYATVIYPSGEMQARQMPEAVEAETPVRLSLEPIYFDFDKYNIKHRYTPILNRDAEYLKENSNIKVAVSGHTDSFGTGEYNMALSERRAKSVYDYLAQKGVPESRMEIVTYGKSRPIASNKTAKGRAQNRRVEVNAE